MVFPIILTFIGLYLGTGFALADTEVSVNAEFVKFYYYRSQNDSSEIIYRDEDSLSRSGIKEELPTVLIIDGFLSTATTPMPQKFINAFTSPIIKDNVIVVDWGMLSGSRSNFTSRLDLISYYTHTVKSTLPKVANRVAEFVNFLKETKNIPFSNFHICGHSLGAHIAGIAGTIIQKLFNGKLGRISGLDPAGPLVDVAKPDLKLTKGDATFVDIYHTNRKELGSHLFETGDLTVFVNGGDDQPGCDVMDATEISFLKGICSHWYSWKFFAATFHEAIKGCPCHKLACQCHTGCLNDSCETKSINVGINAPKTKTGSFHVIITDPLA